MSGCTHGWSNVNDVADLAARAQELRSRIMHHGLYLLMSSVRQRMACGGTYKNYNNGSARNTSILVLSTTDKVHIETRQGPSWNRLTFSGFMVFQKQYITCHVYAHDARVWASAVYSLLQRVVNSILNHESLFLGSLALFSSTLLWPLHECRPQSISVLRAGYRHSLRKITPFFMHSKK